MQRHPEHVLNAEEKEEEEMKYFLMGFGFSTTAIGIIIPDVRRIVVGLIILGIGAFMKSK